MKKKELVDELVQRNPVLAELMEDWTDVSSYSFWRFFPNEQSLRLWDQLIRHVIKAYDSPHVSMYKSDVAGMVLVLDHCVVRTYRTARYLKIRPLYRLRNPYLEKCLMSRQLGHFGVFVCKKIQPLVKMDDLTLSVQFTPSLFEKLLTDVEKGISKIHSYGYCHNDVSLDNTGYDPETGNFVLFDFDASSRNNSVFGFCADRISWEKSLHTWSKFLP